MLRLRVLVVLSVLSIVGILAVQAVWVSNAYALRERQFRQSAFIALQDVADEVARLNKFTLNRYAVTQLSADYFIVNTDAPIDPVTLESFIQKSLEAHNLITDYEYGIYNCETDRMVYGAYVGTSSKTGVQRSRNLPKFPRYTYYFGIRFPNQVSFITGQLSILLWSTIIVVLVVIFFGYTLNVVLKQRRLTETQRDFINNITHELQTPVSTIRIAAYILQSEEITKQPHRLKQYARILNEESRRLQKQVNNVLQLAKSERTGFDLNITEVDLHELMTTAAATFGEAVKLNLTATNPHIRADRYHLETVLNNLIDNGLKYCKQTPCVTLHTRIENDQLVWAVQDNGIGIAPKYQKAIFKQFFRVPTGHEQNGKGFGLGLYYVRQVIRAHGWKLSLTSELGQGSTFEIRSSERIKERKSDMNSKTDMKSVKNERRHLFTYSLIQHPLRHPFTL